MVGWMNDRHRHLALPSFPQYADSLTGMLHINGCKLKSLLLESAAASSFASLPAYFENNKVYTNAVTAYVNTTKPINQLGDLSRSTRQGDGMRQCKILVHCVSFEIQSFPPIPKSDQLLERAILIFKSLSLSF
jgi:hypothetical protein